MDINTFKREAETLAKPATILRDSGDGDPVAYWHGIEPDSPCISIRREAGWLNVSLDGLCIGGQAELSSKPIKSDIPLFAHPFTCLPPVDAIFMHGSKAVGDFLAQHNWPRDVPFNDNFPSPVPEEYEIFWQQGYPLYQSDVDAVLGGWHMFWPDGDWHSLLKQKLVAWTLRDSEPWVEVWQNGSDFTVIQRVT